MKHLIEFPMEDGDSILVEVEDLEAEPDIELASAGEMISRAGQTFETALERVKPAASVIIKKLRGLVDPPDEIAVEFGLKMSAEAGAVVAAAGAEANYRVTLTWKKEERTTASSKDADRKSAKR